MCLDTVNYFREDTVNDAILNQNMIVLMNYKLTPNTFNGAEDYNNKFNDTINTLQQQGHSQTLPSSKVYTLQTYKIKLMSTSGTKLAQMLKLPFLEFNQPDSGSTCLLLEREGEVLPLS